MTAFAQSTLRALIPILALGLMAADVAEPADRATSDLSALDSTLSDIRAQRPAADSAFAAMLHLSDGDKALSARDWAKAAAAYQTVLHLDPNQARARNGLAEAWLASGQVEKAAKLLNDAAPLSLRLRVAMARGTLDNPERQLRAGFTQTGDSRLLNVLGRWLDERGRGADARAAFAQAAPLQRAGLAQNNIGLSYMRTGATHLAKAAFEQALQDNPTDPVFDRNARLFSLMQGDYVTGLDGLRAADAAPLLRKASQSAMQRGDDALAVLLLDHAERLSVRHDPRLAQLRAQLENKRSDPAENP